MTTGPAARALPWLIAGIGAALALVGLALLLVSGPEPLPPPMPIGPLEDAETGAYQSTMTFTYVDVGTVRTTVGQLVGGGVLVLGLLVLTAVGGWAAGLRTARRRAG